MTQSQIVDLITVSVSNADSTAFLMWGSDRDFGVLEKSPPTVVLVYPIRDSEARDVVTTSLTIKVKKLDSSNNTNANRKTLGDECRSLAFKIWNNIKDFEPAYVDANSFTGNNNYNQSPKGYTEYIFNINVVSTVSKCLD